MPNIFAYIMLGIWPLVVAVMFRRMPVERALIWSVLGGYLFLPPVAAFDIDILPPLDKHAIPILAAFFALWATQGHVPRIIPESRAVRLTLAIYLLGCIGTVLTNSEPVINGQARLPGLPITEIVVSMFNQVVIILPLLLAQSVLRSPKALRELTIAFVVAGVIYSAPMLLEIRLSPQLNTWVYGFFQHTFAQMVRYGGYRPMVFLTHGLWVAMFAFVAVAAAASLLRNEVANRPRYLAAMIYLAGVLVLCKSAGPLIYMICFAPLILFASRRTQVRIAAGIALIVIIYPMLRGAGFIPTEAILNQVGTLDAERWQSLGFRLANEDMLLAHASERPWFGWGGWDRNHVQDPLTGRSVTVTDGLWIIWIGTSGWIGYLSIFGLLTLPLFILTARTMRRTFPIAPYVGPLAVILGASLVDLVPNATLVSFTWLVAGALLGYACQEESEKAKVSESPAAPILDMRSAAPWARGTALRK